MTPTSSASQEQARRQCSAQPARCCPHATTAGGARHRAPKGAHQRRCRRRSVQSHKRAAQACASAACKRARASRPPDWLRAARNGGSAARRCAAAERRSGGLVATGAMESRAVQELNRLLGPRFAAACEPGTPAPPLRHALVTRIAESGRARVWVPSPRQQNSKILTPNPSSAAAPRHGSPWRRRRRRWRPRRRRRAQRRARAGGRRHVVPPGRHARASRGGLRAHARNHRH